MAILRYILLTAISLLVCGVVCAGVIVVTFEETQPSAAAPGGWTPSNEIDGLVLWLDADNANTITLSGNNVTQ